jgi:cation diffusion facilitator CzcD-associated flavoprotein CzcO
VVKFISPVQSIGNVDVLIVGAGISGIGIGQRLKGSAKSFAIVDGRESIGGTWDLFRYPGIRSDSDLHTFGFDFKPWTGDNAIADASEILEYLDEAVEENDLRPNIHLGLRVVHADFSTESSRWTVTLSRAADDVRFEIECGFLVAAAGYYDYDRAFTPTFEGRDEFVGEVVHPQFWPENLDYAGKKVVVIGSGATAVTLLPSMTDKAEHVTMLQRSPSYIMSVPRQDKLANALKKALPPTTAYSVTRRVNLAMGQIMFALCKRYPEIMRRVIRRNNTRALPVGYPVDTHFKPTYEPWDQRLCAAPDGDMFKAIRSGSASVVTDHIARFTNSGILLESGQHLDADLVITATGLEMRAFGGVELSVDGKDVVVGERVAFNAMMLDGVPNFAFVLGYTNSSWTLKVGLVADHLCRLLHHMDRHGFTSVTPPAPEQRMTRTPYFDLSSGYVQRGRDLFPTQGDAKHWKVVQDFSVDKGRLVDEPIGRLPLRFSTTVDNDIVTLPQRGATA